MVETSDLPKHPFVDMLEAENSTVSSDLPTIKVSIEQDWQFVEMPYRCRQSAEQLPSIDLSHPANTPIVGSSAPAASSTPSTTKADNISRSTTVADNISKYMPEADNIRMEFPHHADFDNDWEVWDAYNFDRYDFDLNDPRVYRRIQLAHKVPHDYVPPPPLDILVQARDEKRADTSITHCIFTKTYMTWRETLHLKRWNLL